MLVRASIHTIEKKPAMGTREPLLFHIVDSMLVEAKEEAGNASARLSACREAPNGSPWQKMAPIMGLSICLHPKLSMMNLVPCLHASLVMNFLENLQRGPMALSILTRPL